MEKNKIRKSEGELQQMTMSQQLFEEIEKKADLSFKMSPKTEEFLQKSQIRLSQAQEKI